MLTLWKNQILLRLPLLRLWLMRRSDERQLRALKQQYQPLTEEKYPGYVLERDLILDPTYGLVAEMLEKKARKLGIRVPDKSSSEDNDNWEQSRYTGDWMLTPDAERALRNEIREEQRAHADEWRKWATLFFVVIGSVFAFLSYRTKQKQPDPCQVNYYRNDSGACVFALPAVPNTPQPKLLPSKPKVP